jgi:hypothetical protein
MIGDNHRAARFHVTHQPPPAALFHVCGWNLGETSETGVEGESGHMGQLYP